MCFIQTLSDGLQADSRQKRTTDREWMQVFKVVAKTGLKPMSGLPQRIICWKGCLSLVQIRLENISMSDKNSFRDSLRVDSETMAKLDSVSKNYKSKKSSNSKTENAGGRERGDEGPGRQGREPGYKSGNDPRASAVKNVSSKGNNGSSKGRAVAVKGSVSSSNSNVSDSTNSSQSNGLGQTGSSSAGNGSSGHGQGR